MAGPSRPVITLNKAMTHTQVYILSRLTVSRDHTRKQIYPNKNSPHPTPPTPRYQHLCDVAPPPAISNLQPPPPPPPPLPRQLPSDDNRLERLDPKGCPPLDRKSHPWYRLSSVCTLKGSAAMGEGRWARGEVAGGGNHWELQPQTCMEVACMSKSFFL